MSPEAERLISALSDASHQASLTVAKWPLNLVMAGSAHHKLEAARAALAAHIEALERRPHWMPIEDAPKDGTWVDLWAYPLSGGAGGRIPNAAWSAGAWRDQWSTSDGVPGPKIDMRITHFMAHAAPPAKDAT